jgi:endoribonuclease Dicer
MMQGDSFLKYFSSVYVFVFNPALSEGALHKARQHIISNKVLTQCGLSIGLPSYIQGKTFSCKLWQPPNFTVQDVSPPHLERSNNLASSSGNGGIENDTNTQAPVNDTNASTTQLTSHSKTKHKAPDDNITQWLGDKVERVFHELKLSHTFVDNRRCRRGYHRSSLSFWRPRRCSQSDQDPPITCR